MVDAFISSVIDQLSSILRQQVEEELRLVAGVDKEARELQSNLQSIKDVLKDAEKRQVKENVVRKWLQKLKNIAYDMEDVLEDWSTAIQDARGHQGTSKPQVPIQKACVPITSLSSCFKQVGHVALRHNIGKEMREIKERLDQIIREKKLILPHVSRVAIQEFNFYTRDTGELELNRETTSRVDAEKVYGRDDEKNSLVNMLFSGSSQEQEPQIIALRGPGGVGKTTLARLAYNDNTVKSHFRTRLWVCVSSPFDKIRVAKDILRAFGSDVQDSSTHLDSLLEEISECAATGMFLLVLDDVWTENRKEWEEIWLSLKFGSPGSRIIVTTRKEEVSNMMRATHKLLVGLLSEDQCWLVFKDHAFSGRTDDHCQTLEDVGRRIARKCGGLPLAAELVGGFMRDKTSDLQQWELVAESKIWEAQVSEDKSIFPYLLLSYFDLPSPVKRCFAYCSIFPKDYQIIRDELIQLWMAQGYLSFRGEENMEVVGEECFHKLAMRSFFQNVKTDAFHRITCEMHSIVHDFALFLTENEVLTIDVDAVTETGVDEAARHVTLICTESSQLPPSLCNAKKIRTIFVDDSSFRKFHYVKAPLEPWQLPRCLRAFHCCPGFRAHCIFQVPRKIKDLKHLRYLSLQWIEGLKELPAVVCDLYNLQTLNLRGCWELQKLPQQIGNLVKLRHLDLMLTRLEFLPREIKNLSCLRTLTFFKVCNDSQIEALSLRDLKHLTHLGGYLNIIDLGSTEDQIELENSKNLLYLDLSLSGNGSCNADIINNLKPPPALRGLRLRRFSGTYKLPHWMMSLVELKLDNNNSCEALPALGKISSLERLSIHWVGNVRKVGSEFLGTGDNEPIAFPKLKELKFSWMHSWEIWDGENDSTIVMPSLTKLHLHSCYRLKSLPSFLLKIPLQRLDIFSCPELVKEKNNFSHIPDLIFH